jgi:hypothetical protein
LKDSDIFFRECLSEESVDICNECFYNNQCKGSGKKESFCDQNMKKCVR